jgi:hypothetical protein
MNRILSLFITVCIVNTLLAAEPKKQVDLPTTRTEKQISGWKVLVDDRLLSEPNQELAAKSLKFLEAKLDEIKIIVPADKVAKLQTVKIVLDLSHGGLVPFQYHPSAGWLKDNGYSPDLAKCVHLPRAKDLTTSRNVREQPMVILHELAHAYHDQFLDFDNPRVKEIFEQYKKSGNGEKTLLYNGKRTKHYALTDHKEFFAEMTESYFGSNDFYPFNRAELIESEPAIFELMKKVWTEQ